MKRISYILLCVAIILSLVFLTSCKSGGSLDESENETSAQQEATAPEKGHWELTKTTCEPNQNIISDHSKTVFSVEQTSHTKSYSYADEEDVLGGEVFQGSYVCTSTDMPEKYYPGDTVSITLTAEALSYSNTERMAGIAGKAEFQSNFPSAIFTPAKITKGLYDTPFYHASAGNIDETGYEFVQKSDNTYTLLLNEDYAGVMKTFWVVFRTDAGESVWEYSWKKD